MSYNGSGTFQINSTGQPVVSGTVISSTAFNALTADLATGLSTAITKDGQTATTARIPFAAGINSTLVTDSTSTTTGSIITAGGAGVAKALFVGTTANVAGAVTLQSTLGVTGITTFSAQPIFSSLTASSAVATDASKGLVSVTNTGTGNNVLATSPTLVTPVLGAASATSVTVAAGAVGTPSITTAGDTNTGIFFPAADTIAFAEGGVERARIDSSGNLGLGVTPSPWDTFTASFQIDGASLSGLGANNTALASNAYYQGAWKYYGTGSASLYQQNAGQHAWSVAGSGTAGNAITFTQAMTLDASGNVGIGTGSPTSKVHISQSGASTSLTIDGIENPIFATRYAANGDGATIFLAKSRNATVGSQTIVQNGDQIGVLQARASNGTSFVDAASILFAVDGTPGAGNDMPGRIVFGTSPDGSASITERMRIDSSGNLLVGTTSPGSVSSTGLTIASGKYLWNVGAYNFTTATGANLVVQSDGIFQRSSSALKYKQDIRDIEAVDISNFRPVRYKSKCEGDDQTKDYFGIVADEVADAGVEELVTRGADGEVEGFQYDRFTVVLVKAIQEQQAIITQLQADVAALKTIITSLENK